ncbi:MAG: hypothetical protein V3T77_09895 [Planctomycetota bacterium]
MRGVSLPQEPVFSLLKDDFVLGWKNIITQEYVGESRGYGCDQAAVGTTNGAGPRNVQIVILSPDGVVLHALPGFWHPDDLATELGFAKKLYALWKRQDLTLEEKRVRYGALQLAEIGNHSAAMVARCGWQNFDRKKEYERLQEGPRDVFTVSPNGELLKNRRGKPQLKSTNVVVHERMAQRAFVSFADFDVSAYVDYGRLYYDNNRRIDGNGITFMTPRMIEKQRLKDERKARAAQRRRLTAELRKGKYEKIQKQRRALLAERRIQREARLKKAAEQRRKLRAERHLRLVERQRAAAERRHLAAQKHRVKLAEAAQKRVRIAQVRARLLEERRKRAVGRRAELLRQRHKQQSENQAEIVTR